MQNKKHLVISSLLRHIIEIFSKFFLNIYLFKLVDGDFNFILLYATISTIAGCIFGYFLMRIINQKNANFIFKTSYICEIISVLMLLLMKEQIINVIWIFALIYRYSRMAYYAVYEVTLIRSTRKDSISSYLAGVDILSSIIAICAPVAMGFLITDYSYYVVFILILIDSILAIIVASRMNFKVIDEGFHLAEYWKKAFKNKRMRQAYAAAFFKRFSDTAGIFGYLMPILLFLVLGTEFSAGSYNSLFSVVYIILLEIVRIFNKKHKAKNFYVPMALLCLTSSIIMASNTTVFTVLLFYFTGKTAGSLIMTETTSMLYAIGRKEKLASYTREHQFTWNLFLAMSSLTGIFLAFIIYNNFQGVEAYSIIIAALMVFLVAQSYMLQKLESVLKNK